MARVIYDDCKMVRFQQGSLYSVLQIAERWLDDNREAFIIDVVCTQDGDQGDWFLTIYFS